MAGERLIGDQALSKLSYWLTTQGIESAAESCATPPTS